MKSKSDFTENIPSPASRSPSFPLSLKITRSSPTKRLTELPRFSKGSFALINAVRSSRRFKNISEAVGLASFSCEMISPERDMIIDAPMTLVILRNFLCIEFSFLFIIVKKHIVIGGIFFDYNDRRQS